MVPKATANKLEYHIKLLAGNNVVMIEANGYESEIFTPQVINGRISFQNIIPNRRCCLSTAAPKHSTKSKKISLICGVDSTTQTERKALLANSNSKAWRMNAGTESRFVTPQAYSTPTANGAGKENYRSGHHKKNSNNSNLPTPELPRRIPQPHEVAYESILRIPSSAKVLRIHRNPTLNTPNRVGRIIGNIKSDLRTAQIVNTSKMTPSSSPLPCYTSDCSPGRPFPELRSCRNNMLLNTPTPSGLQKPSTPGTVTKWRKCITPVRTYSRRQIQKRASIASVKKIRSKFNTTDRNGKVLPTYMVNPTQGTRPSLKIEVKKRKIVIDSKTAISPRTFKRHQNETDDLKNNSSYQLPKNRKEYESMKHSAFDLLTNSNRSRSMSSKLNIQFRKGCVNKVSSTCPKYKTLCAVVPLEKKDGEQQKKQITIASGPGDNSKNQTDKYQ